jgi:hypothetical protein
MIKLAFIQSFKDHRSGVAKVLKDSEGLLVHSMGIVILCDCTIVVIRELAVEVTIIK